MYAFVAEDTGPDDEGIISAPAAVHGPFHTRAPMPLVGADQGRVESLKPIAQRIADVTGKPVKLLLFSVRTEVAVFAPHAGERNGH
jgi:hypothetical protein